MIGMVEISQAITACKTAKELLGTMIGLRDAKLISEKAAEFTGIISTVQQSMLVLEAANLALINDKRVLEEKLIKMEKWESEKNKYTLDEVAPGMFACIRNPDAEPAEPEHHICADCMNNGHKYILQKNNDSSVYASRKLTCNGCKSVLVTKRGATLKASYGRHAVPSPFS